MERERVSIEIKRKRDKLGGREREKDTFSIERKINTCSRVPRKRKKEREKKS
jgi:hypothetical protein